MKLKTNHHLDVHNALRRHYHHGHFLYPHSGPQTRAPLGVIQPVEILQKISEARSYLARLYVSRAITSGRIQQEAEEDMDGMRLEDTGCRVQSRYIKASATLGFLLPRGRPVWAAAAASGLVRPVGVWRRPVLA